MSRSTPKAAVLLGALACAAGAPAQDAHYWNYGYGPVGQLTEGALVGGVSDLSAVYYNPAACALLDQPRFVFSLNSIELASIEVPGAAGEGLDFDQGLFDVVPAMVAGHVGAHDGGKNHFAFAFLSRNDSDFDLGYTRVGVPGAGAPGAAGFGRFRQRVVEYWMGGAWSRKVGDRLSIGVSPFFAYHGQRSRQSLTLEAVDGAASTAAFVGSEVEFNHVRLLGKLGVAWRPGRWELGATLTTPGVKLWGNGKSLFNASLAGSSVPPYLSAASEDGLAPTCKAPLSVAVGATRRWQRTALHTSAEWFSSTDPYTILEPQPAPIAGSADTVDLVFTGAAESVFNVAVGLEQSLGDRWVAYAGAARNASAYVPRRQSFAAWDLTEVTAGVTFDRGGPKWALGVGYAWGSDEIVQVILPPGSSAEPPRPADFSRWTISFGASFNTGPR